MKKYLGKILGVVVIIAFSGCATQKGNMSGESIEKYIPGKTIHSCDKAVVLCGGCFDILHHGHFEFLKNAKKEGDVLVVALEPDSKIIKDKKRMPVHNQKERAKNLVHLKSVDKVLMLPHLKGEKAYGKLVKDVKPAVVAITYDDPQKKNKALQAKKVGAELKSVIHRMKKFSSTKICSRDLKRNKK